MGSRRWDPSPTILAPSPPPWQARATAVRAHCVRLLQDPSNSAEHAPSYAAEDASSGELAC